MFYHKRKVEGKLAWEALFFSVFTLRMVPGKKFFRSFFEGYFRRFSFFFFFLSKVSKVINIDLSHEFN